MEILIFGAWSVEKLSIQSEQYDYRGLFGNVGENATIKNGSIISANINGNNYVSALAGKNYGKIEYMSISSDSIIKGQENVGGIAG